MLIKACWLQNTVSWLHPILPKWIKLIKSFCKEHWHHIPQENSYICYIYCTKNIADLFDLALMMELVMKTLVVRVSMKTRNLKMSSLDSTLDVYKEKINVGPK